MGRDAADSRRYLGQSHAQRGESAEERVESAAGCCGFFTCDGHEGRWPVKRPSQSKRRRKRNKACSEQPCDAEDCRHRIIATTKDPTRTVAAEERQAVDVR